MEILCLRQQGKTIGVQNRTENPGIPQGLERLSVSKTGTATTSKKKSNPYSLGQASPPILGVGTPRGPPFNLGSSLCPWEARTFHQVPHRHPGPIPAPQKVHHRLLTLYPARDPAQTFPFRPAGTSQLWSLFLPWGLCLITRAAPSVIVFSLTCRSWSSDPQGDMRVGPCL